MKFTLLFTLFSVTQAAYISRMTSVNRVRAPSVFRPGVIMQRPWNHPRIVPASSHRAPSYVLYRNSPHRYAMKHYPSTRNVFTGGPWKTTVRMPGLSPVTPEYEFVRAASAPPQLMVHHDGGAIHTIPAPNLSLSEKPIVVIEASDNPQNNKPATEQPKPTYEVTEKYPDNVYQVAKIETPVGFSKGPAQTASELRNLIRDGVAFQQMVSEYGLSAIGIPQNQMIPQQQHYTIQGFNGLNSPQGFNGIQNPQGFNGIPNPQGFNGMHIPQVFNGIQIPHGFNTVQNQQGFNNIPSLQGLNGIHTPQGFNGLPTQQNFNGLPTQQDLLNSGADGIMIAPNALYQSDPNFLQKLQSQLLQRFPSVEFIPYPAEVPSQNTRDQNNQQQAQQLLENEELKHEQFQPSESKNVVQRETLESSVVNLIPQNIIVRNVTEKPEPPTTVQPHNITLELIAAESRPVTTTIKYVIESTEKQESIEKQNTTPIYYAQIGQSIGNVIANGFYSAINDVRAASASEQVEKPNETTTAQVNITTASSDSKSNLSESEMEQNKTVNQLKPLHGIPFSKSADSVKLAYTLLRLEDKEPKSTQEGDVYAGQIVEASISEDQDFNNEKANLIKRPPIRLFAVTEKKDVSGTATSSFPKVTIVKAKIPPKSKLTFDEETGEPVLRIYASYANGQTQKDAATSKPLKQVRQTATHHTVDSWKSSTVRSADKTQGFDGNQVTQFGLKLRSRSDDYIPLFEYDE